MILWYIKADYNRVRNSNLNYLLVNLKTILKKAE